MSNEVSKLAYKQEKTPKFYYNKLFFAKTVHKEPRTYGLHWHNYYELCHVKTDTISLIINDKTYPLKKDDIIIIAPHVVHDTLNNTDEMQYFTICQFKPEFLNDFTLPNSSTLLFLKDLFQRGFVHIKKHKNDCANLLDIILKNVDEPNEFTKNIIFDGCFTALLGILVQNDILGYNIAQHSGFNLLSIRNFVEENLTNGVSLKTVAELFNYEETYFSKKFKLLTGINFKDFLQTLKLNRAQHLLLSKNMSVNKVSEMLGYANVANFCRAYKDAYGISPSAHKKQQAALQLYGES